MEQTRPNDFPKIKENLFVIAWWNEKPWPDASRLVRYLSMHKDKTTEIAVWSSWDQALTFKSKGEADKVIAKEAEFRKSKGIDKPMPGGAISIKALKRSVKWGFV